MKRLFLFDLDGTLVSTGGAGLRALSRAFQELHGIENAMATINPSGKTDPAIFREMVAKLLGRDLAPGEAEKMGQRYLQHLETEMKVPGGKGALAGVMAFVQHLAGRADAVLALGTGNLESGARLKLAPHGLNPFFPIGGFGSDSEDRAELLRFGHRRAQGVAKEPIAPENVFVLGDTPLDVAAAHRAGFRSVGVATGHTPVEDLKKAEAEFVMPDLTHGFAWLESIDAAEPAR